jgi:eukaryotic-like serine/threonine-protein kinase
MRPTRVGRYLLFDVLARGGMAQVHLARLVGDAGFSRVVAIKRLHSHLASDRRFVEMFLDEARLAARIRHPNVVPILDVVAIPDELFLVLEYVSGESLAELSLRCQKTGTRIPPDVAVGVMTGVLAGLHAAHEATGEDGAPLGIVHRDVSPQNVMLGEDGFARVLDFGIAYALERLQSTQTGSVKGKLGYLAPEQLSGQRVDRRTDVYGAGVVLWEALTGQRLFRGDNEAHTLSLIAEGARTKPSELVAEVPPELDRAVMRALSVERETRQSSAHELASELARAIAPAAPDRIANFALEVAGDVLTERRRRVRAIEATRQESLDAEPQTALAAGRAEPPEQPAVEPVPATLRMTDADSPNGAIAPERSAPVAPFVFPAMPIVVEQRPTTAIWASLLALVAVVASGWFVVRSLEADLERSLAPQPKPRERPGLPDRLKPKPAVTAPAPPASAAPAASTGARLPRPVASTQKKPAHCVPPYITLPNGQQVMKYGCD